MSLDDLAPLEPPSRQVLRAWQRRARKHPWRGQNRLPPDWLMRWGALTEPGRWTNLQLTYDEGYHVSGWWKNGGYDRCWHLSVSHPTKLQLETPTEAEVYAWCKLLWRDAARMAWVEGAASTFDPNRLTNVVHARLFLDENEQPCIPEGEVYTPLRVFSPKVLQTIGGDVH